MTSGEVATATGLGRATVGTTLSRLAKAGEVTKAARGYQLVGQAPAGAAADAASPQGEQPAG
jgi:predicted transcriptional regulator of viral defense system